MTIMINETEKCGSNLMSMNSKWSFNKVQAASASSIIWYELVEKQIFEWFTSGIIKLNVFVKLLCTFIWNKMWLNKSGC